MMRKLKFTPLNKKHKFFFIFITISLLLIIYIAPLAIIKIDIPFLPKFEGTTDFPLSSTSFYYSNTNDDTKLFAHYIPTTKNTVKGTIILVHGIRSNSNYFANNISKITNQGYNVACPDLRAHGKSEGDYCTYGYYEKEDISCLIDYLEKHYEKTTLGIWGNH